MTNSKVAERWIEQACQYQYSSSGNMFFEGKTIYSYGHHFPIATIVNRNGEEAILFTTRGYSATTAKHKCHVRNVIPYCMDVFYVDTPLDTNDSFERNENYAINDIKDVLKRLVKSRSKFNDYLKEALNLVNKNIKYCDFLGNKPHKNILDVKWALNTLKGNTLRVWCNAFNKK